jgi:NAD(P)-dependent dehydrogenase (short-subunit alcohol dehydrogenase family)
MAVVLVAGHVPIGRPLCFSHQYHHDGNENIARSDPLMTDAIYQSLRRRPVLITGGATGIGEAMVRAFADQGAQVAFVDIADEEGHALATELGGAKGQVHFASCDITDTAALQAAIGLLAGKCGPFTVLVNNAAHDERHDWRKVTPEYYDDRIAVNLKHQFFAIQAVAPAMIEAGGGSIVNFGSISWMIPNGGYPVYATCKAAVHGMTRSLARDLGKSGIRLNIVAPGWVMTRRQLELWVDEKGERQMDENQCLRGRVMPQDIAAMVLFLASDDSRMITGQEFIVDGGWV